MKLSTFICLLGAILILFSNALRAQGPVHLFTIKGVVVDSAGGKPLEYVTVSLKDQTNKPLKTALSDSKGHFSFSKLSAGAYQVTAVSVGYKPATVKVPPIGANSGAEVNAGTIRLTAKNNQLKEVSVTADKPVIQQEPDRISYDLQADPESKVNNVLDMMRKVPLLSLDADDNIKLQGNSNYKILINGKPSSMVAKNPKDVLRSMPASSIQKIEVITTPPSKYDSEGLAGIINIITTKKIDNGYNGSININERFPVGGPGAGGSFTLKQGKFGASGYGGVGYYSQPSAGYHSSRLSNGAEVPLSRLFQNGTREFDNNYKYLGTELSFEIDTLNLITAEVGFNDGTYDAKGMQDSRTFDALDAVTTGYTTNDDSRNTWSGIDLALNYQKGFKGKKDRLLTFSYRYSNSDDNTFDSHVLANRISWPMNDYRQKNNGGSGEQTIQLDYVHPVNKKLTVEAGLKAILRDNNSDFRYDSLNVDGVFVNDPLRTNTFDNNQDVFGAYTSYQYNIKDWGFKAGVRVEETTIKADFISRAQELDKDFFNIIPTFSLNRKFKNMSSLNFGFTQRIQRPSIWNLNPFVDRSNPNFESAGNPDLKPVVSNDIRMGYSRFKKGSINIGINYSFSNNTIQQFSVYDKPRQVTYTTYGNIGKDRTLGTNFNVNYPITKAWNFNISGNMNYVWLKGMINGREASNSGVRGYFYGGTGYKFNKGWRLNADFSYSSPYINLQGQGSSYYYTSLSASKELIKEKLTFSAATSNPFNKYRYFVNETTGAGFSQSSTYQNYFRSYRLSLNYRFGKLQGGIKKNQRGIKNDDVSGGKSNESQ